MIGGQFAGDKMKRDDQHNSSDATIGRRRFLKMGAAATAALLIPGAALADDWIRVEPEKAQPRARLRTVRMAVPRTGDNRGVSARELAFYNVHTGESLKTVYYEDGHYVPGALHEVNYFFRDFRANEIKPIDTELLDVLYDIRGELGTNRPFNLVSGYRSAATNAWLASLNEGVARHSMHVEGKASDIHVPGVQLADLQRAALMLGAGGVGYYPRAGFVHVDTGRVRRW
jgi:uncharacterized protein YcbK (DUF882 family)